MTYALGFIGAGNMAEATARAAIEQGVMAASQMTAFDPAEARRDVFAQLGVAVAADNAAVIAQSRHVLLAVKPQMVAAVAPDLAAHAGDETIVMSIMAGIPSAKLNALVQEAGGPRLRIVRIMPNTPLMVGCGMAGVARGDGARDGDEALAMKLFSAGESKALRIDEAMIDAVTAVSGSGPAYVFYLAEAMAQAARDLGFDADDARLLVSQTIVGAAKLMLASEDAPAELRRKVASPGGTTEAAITHMDGRQVKQAVIGAVHAAARRGRELGA